MIRCRFWFLPRDEVLCYDPPRESHGPKLAAARSYLEQRGIGCMRPTWTYQPACKTDIARTFEIAKAAR